CGFRPHCHAVSSMQKIARHRVTHEAQTEESKFCHRFLLSLNVPSHGTGLPPRNKYCLACTKAKGLDNQARCGDEDIDGIQREFRGKAVAEFSMGGFSRRAPDLCFVLHARSTANSSPNARTSFSGD